MNPQAPAILGSSYTISAQGLESLLRRPKDPKYPQRHIMWTDDFTVELPIKRASEGIGALEPTTIIDEFRRSAKIYANRSAISVKRNGKWQATNYADYYNLSVKFAASMIAYKFPQYTSINIIGFNSPEWAIAFFGGLFSRSISTGIYTTNSQQVCEFIAENSECKLLVAENMQYVSKYLKLIKTGKISLVVLYADPKADVSQFAGRIVQWADFMKEGERVDIKNVEARMSTVKPGNCATLVYTSGTTGMPKGVMLSHDNLTWCKRSLDAYYEREDRSEKLVSYLPLSHIAGIFSDLVTPVMSGYHVFFAQPDALQGSLIQTLKEVRPTIFFSVPRVWEKIQEKMKDIGKQNGWLKKKLATWAQSVGPQGSIQQFRKQPTSFQFQLAKKLIYTQIKKHLGLDECSYLIYAAAPLDPEIRYFFLSLNMPLINIYGMSECTGPQNISNKEELDYKDRANMKQAGSNIPGTDIKIVKSDPKDQDGEIYYRGRHIFMGYFKNPDETNKNLDEEGFLHSGDIGKINDKNVLFITGRVKELIITAGGENIPPVVIESQIKAALPFISNVMVVGEGRKYLNCLICLRQDTPGSGNLEKNSKQYLSSKGCAVSTVKEASKDPKVKKIILEGLEKANQKAISRAQNVQNFFILPEDFSVENGLLTPTMKLKRKEVSKKYAKQIEETYMSPKL